MKASDRLRHRAAEIVEFRDKYLELMGCMTFERPDGYGPPEMVPKKGQQRQVETLFPQVARAAGRARTAAAEDAPMLALTQFGQTRTIDPIAGWKYSIDMPEHLPVNTVLDCCENVIGTLEAKAKDAERIEGTMVGRVAAFVGFPARVRAAVAAEHPGLGPAAFGVGVLGQIVIGVLVSIIAAGIVAGVVALWNWTF